MLGKEEVGYLAPRESAPIWHARINILNGLPLTAYLTVADKIYLSVYPGFLVNLVASIYVMRLEIRIKFKRLRRQMTSFQDLVSLRCNAANCAVFFMASRACEKMKNIYYKIKK